MSEDIIFTNVNKVMMNFHLALINIYPCLKWAKIPVGITEGYDAWDEISETLYKHLVLELLRYSTPEEQMYNIQFPAYEAYYKDFSQFNFIKVEVQSNHQQQDIWVFNNFTTQRELFDSLECYSLDESWKLKTEQKVILFLKDIKFKFLFKVNNTVKIIEDLEIR